MTLFSYSFNVPKNPKILEGAGIRILIAAMALGLTCFVASVAFRKNESYLKEHTYYGDTASYYYTSLKAYNKSIGIDRYTAALNEYASNFRNPLRTMPYILFYPDGLLGINGHLWSAAVMFFCFIFMFGLVIYQRTNNAAYSLIAQGIFLIPVGFFDPELGFPANYPDFHAALMVGSALFALFLSRRGQSTGWLFAFGAFAGLSTLSRFVAAGFTFALCGPILIYYLYVRYRETGRYTKGLILPLLIIGFPIGITTGCFLFNVSLVNLNFYRVGGYALGGGIPMAIDNIIQYINKYFGSNITIFSLISFFYFTLNWDKRKIDSDLLVTIWAAIAHLLLFVFVLQVNDDIHTVHYFLPGFALLAVAPFSVKKRMFAEPKFNWISGLAFALIISSSIVIANNFLFNKYSSVPQNEKKMLSFVRDIGLVTKNASNKITGRLGRAAVFDTFFYEFGPRVVLESAYQYKTYLNHEQIFKTHVTGWNLKFPCAEPAMLPSLVYAEMLENLNLVWVLRNPYQSIYKTGGDNISSKNVIGYVNHMINTEPENWQFEYSLESPWGTIDLYMNKHSLCKPRQ